MVRDLRTADPPGAARDDCAVTKFLAFNSLTDARWNDDHSAATHLRSPMTLEWVEMKPPVPIAAFVYQQAGDFWHRFGDWCKAAWDVGRCIPAELTAGPVRPDDRGGWILEPKPCCDLHGRNCEPPSELCCFLCTEADHPTHRKRGLCSNPDLSRPSPAPGFDSRASSGYAGSGGIDPTASTY